ncbi:MAG: MBL fold metallo-hydrolase [Crocinitomicaceae bacterium]|nr:MBL fold metallo-hydrolase [Crocinitomicaceae bacterium]
MVRKAILLIGLMTFFSCENSDINSVQSEILEPSIDKISEVSIVVLGTIQDAGSPQAGCQKDCCKGLFEQPDLDRKIVSLGFIDPEFQKKYLLEASPDITFQMRILKEMSGFDSVLEMPDGIFLTHAHIGHYTGLMNLGKEAVNASKVPVYAMPRMRAFLSGNGPWSQLVEDQNIVLKELQSDSIIQLTENISIQPILVPHRDEFSETVGFIISGPSKKALFIPDIDKWGKWNRDIIDMITTVDYAFLDATFFDEEEINNRDISEIPHPFIVESLALFENLEPSEKRKIFFIHFNHTNPVINAESEQYQRVIDAGFNVAQIRDVIQL